jgi:methylmalonyl-CoA/ethylmalonyl-CoA epimerase
MPLRFDHIGIVVADIGIGSEHLQSIFGVSLWTQEFADPVNQVNVRFGKDAHGVCYELISPLGERSPIRRALETRDAILNHIAYLTDDLEVSAAELRGHGCIAIGEPKPAIAYGGKRIQFFRSPLRFVIELIDSFEHRHTFLSRPP